MNIEQIEARLAELNTMLTAEGTDLDAVEAEVRSLKEQEAEIRKAAAEEAEKRAAVASGELGGEAKPIIDTEERNKNMFDINSKEYRDAFFATMQGKATPEQRTIFADNTLPGDGVALPVATDSAIWDQVHTAHPILSDINTIRSGMVLKVTRSTPAAITGKKDSDASAEQSMTNIDVVLAGVDYHTYVTLSYAEAQMSQGAFESYLVTEIANAIGEALAKDVFARILSDAAANSVTKGSKTYFESIKGALGVATQAANPVIYAPSALYYAILGEVDANGQPIVRDGVVLGATLKKDNAATKVTIVDPAQFVLNEVHAITMESERDIKNAQMVIGGWMRAEGCLRKTNAAAFIA